MCRQWVQKVVRAAVRETWRRPTWLMVRRRHLVFLGWCKENAQHLVPLKFIMLSTVGNGKNFGQLKLHLDSTIPHVSFWCQLSLTLSQYDIYICHSEVRCLADTTSSLFKNYYSTALTSSAGRPLWQVYSFYFKTSLNSVIAFFISVGTVCPDTPPTL